MRPILLSQLLIALLIFLLLFLIQRKRLFDRPLILALFFGVYFLDNLAITLANHFPGLQIVPNHIWEGFLVCCWSGKLYSVAMALLLVLLLRPIFSKEDVGITFKQSAGSLIPAIVIVMILSIWAAIIGLHAPKGRFDLETQAYLAVMPGINEELIYRGLLLASLNKLFPAKWTVLSARIGWGVVVTSILFALLHGLWVDESLAIHTNLIAFRNALISGALFAWLRERTGSLLMPVVAHGAQDFCLFLFRMI